MSRAIVHLDGDAFFATGAVGATVTDSMTGRARDERPSKYSAVTGGSDRSTA